MASVEIVTIGTEILLGHLVDTNSVHIARALADHGVDVYAKHSVGDNTERLAVMLEDALERADGVIHDRRPSARRSTISRRTPSLLPFTTNWCCTSPRCVRSRSGSSGSIAR